MSAVAATPARNRHDAASRVSLWRIPRSRSLLALGSLGIAVGLLLAAASIYTELLWLEEVDQLAAFWTTLRWKVLAQAVVGLGTACSLLLSFAVVERSVGRAADPGASFPVWRLRRLLYSASAAAGGALALALRSDDTWRMLLLWIHRSDFGTRDPLFHRDVGFFVFSLPLYREVAQWLLETIALTALATVGAYVAAGTFRERRRTAAVRAARAHLLALAAALLVVVAWRFRLDQFALVLPHDPAAPGATYSDVHVRLPALRALSVLALVGAALSVYARRRRVPFVAAAALGLATLAAFAANTELPGVVERFAVQPQQLTRERTHVEQGIAFTRRAYGLDRVAVRGVPDRPALTQADVAEERSTIDNVPLWDSNVIRPALNELEAIGSYYSFPSVSVDRYAVGGRTRVMTVGARQLALQRLSARGWATDRFAYTHGYGVAAVHGGAADRDRYPRIAQQGFGTGANPLGLLQPRVYFGEQSSASPPYTVLATRRAEVDAPAVGDRPPAYHYDGPGGIALSSPLRRLAFAARFRDLDLLLTETVTERSRILMRRDVRDRLQAVAPFLRWDAHPQTAVIDGRVQFLLDGYTTSDSYPYAAPVTVGGKELNYIRVAAHAAIDGFTGQVRIYAAADADPILRAWQAAYPGLLLPASSTPPALAAHLRYPAQLFEAQAQAYATYHAADATALWNGSDAWSQAHQLAGPAEEAGDFPERGVATRRWRMRPAYGMARLPGDDEDRFMLTTPFTPRGRENMVAYLAGSLDVRGRPQLTALSLPRDRLTIGPTQATRRILSSSGVVRKLALLNRESGDLGRSAVSRTVLGAPRVLPVAGRLVTVQPLFLTSGGEGVPRLQLVTVVADGRVGYGRSLAAALRRLARAR